ncbi:MAG: nicotinate phosphoribosyltransferase [Thermoplasmata archaeon]
MKSENTVNNRKIFSIAETSDIMSGRTADVYFRNALRTLEESGFDGSVTMEITVSGSVYPWILISGIQEVINLLEGRNVDVEAVPEGTILEARDTMGVPVPVMTVTGRYRDFAVFETAILGFICQSTGISTYSSMVRVASGDLPFFSFGIRRMHPAISPMIDRATYIGGADGVSGIMGAEIIGTEPVGTMPHAVSIILGDDRAWSIGLSGSRHPKVALIDTFEDEKFAAVHAARAVSDLDYVRLDTPSSRRGDFSNIVREVRWELDVNGFRNVKIMVSGGLDHNTVFKLRKAGATAFGVGTSIASAKPVDFAMDIVEIGDRMLSKRGKFSGRKRLYRCPKCRNLYVVIQGESPHRCSCGSDLECLSTLMLEGGRTVGEYPDARQIRDRSLAEIRARPQRLRLEQES